ncbi:suppressor of fused domain protein [Massilia rubra]|uniref:Suppressor of fused domain protein n=1 Tax=Massilia rubra TaxID=2607910 RepID=A0ABX0LIS3_9BURK|nr:suppressor of fused domain protein [Massilia rubra]NHZ33939.1 suppressor of fused domain protein [Massilia rubra]
MSLFGKLFGGSKKDQGTGAKGSKPAPSVDEIRWQQVYDARSRLFERHFGTLPADILQMMDLSGVWPGGGLYVIPTRIAGEPGVIYSTFGLSNPDMPATVEMVDTQSTSSDSHGQRTVGLAGTLRQKANIRPRTDRPGYGYELIVLARENADWPLWLLQWAAKAEVLKDADFLGFVEKHQGITVEQIGIGEGKSVTLLISKAQAPLPDQLDLPNGKMALLVATVITEDEMRWSMTNGRDRLLAELKKAGVGQMSILDRASVVRIEEPDFAQVASLSQAKELEAKGQLARLLMFPAEFGGEDVAMNVVYVPPRTVRQRTAHIQALRAWIEEGAVNNLDVRPEYKETSFVPSRIHMHASHSDSGEQRTLTLEVW